MPLDDTTQRSGRERMTEYALHDRGLISAKIFRPLGRGAGSKADDERRTEDVVEVRDPALGPIRLKVLSPYPVGVKEEDLLLVLLGLAGLTKDTANRKARVLPSDHPDHGAVVKEIKAEDDCLPCTLYQLRVSPYLLLRELSVDPSYRPSANAYSELEPRLERLSWIGYATKGMEGNKRWSNGASRVLSFRYVEGDDKDRSIVVTFNERIARVILGYVPADDPEAKAKRWYTKISLAERFSLKSDVARILHRLFSVWIDEPKKGAPKRRGGKGRGPVGEALPVRVDTLSEHVYGGGKVSDSTIRMRRSAIRKALGEVGALAGWSVEIDTTKTLAHIRRLPQPSGPVQGVMAL